jgi:hypothetical protein
MHTGVRAVPLAELTLRLGVRQRDIGLRGLSSTLTITACEGEAAEQPREEAHLEEPLEDR